MVRIRRGGYVFQTWSGDHRPRHVHVYRDGRKVLRWDLEMGHPMGGRQASARIRKLIESLVREGRL
jgi:hypothetical protein